MRAIGTAVMNLGQRCILNQTLFSYRLQIPDSKVVQTREAKGRLVSVLWPSTGVDFTAHVRGPCVLPRESSVTVFLLRHCSSINLNTLDFGAGAYLGTTFEGDQSYKRFLSCIPCTTKRGTESPSPGDGSSHNAGAQI